MNKLLTQLAQEPHQIVASDSSQQLSSLELRDKVTLLAAELNQQNIRVMALHADNSINWLLLDLACHLAAVCLIPLPGFFSVSQINHVLESAPVDTILSANPNFIQTIDGLSARIATSRTDQPATIQSYSLFRLRSREKTSPLPEKTGKITFTSGSTGQPRGVCLSNQQLIIQAQALVQAIGLVRPRHLCLLPLPTLLENVGGIYAPLLAGGEVILPGLAEIGFSGSSELDPASFTRCISQYEPDSIILTPQLLLLLLNSVQQGWPAPTSLKFVAVGGGRVAPELLRQAHAVGIPAFEGYGLSECASVVSLNTASANQAGSCGRPLAHLKVSIEDGEIVIAGNPMLGYLDDPASWGIQKVYSGDLGRLDSRGFVHINGRRKNLLISSFGRNINPEWVESELLSHRNIGECVVFGDDRPYCIALLRPAHATADKNSIAASIERTNRRLPDYARIKNWHFLTRSLNAEDGLMTANGRPRRAQIGRHYRQVIDNLYSDSVTNC